MIIGDRESLAGKVVPKQELENHIKKRKLKLWQPVRNVRVKGA